MLQIDDTLKFGKYEDQLLEEVIVDHPDYIVWCIDNVAGFEMDEEAMQLLETSLRSVK